MKETTIDCGATLAPYVLVVVDMQLGFCASLNEATIDAVAGEIEKAKSAKLPIVILEYAKYPKTHERLLQMVDGYDKLAIETKPENDGSTELLEACIGNEYFQNVYRICGVNTLACVQSTVLGIADRLEDSRVEVVKNACNDETGANVWHKFAKRPNVQLV